MTVAARDVNDGLIRRTTGAEGEALLLGESEELTESEIDAEGANLRRACMACREGFFKIEDERPRWRSKRL